MRTIIRNKYEIVKLIGNGATGEVLLAKDLHLERLVAIKKMAKIEESRKEMQVLRGLKHMGLPAIYDYFEDDQKGCLVMEFIEGITMKQYLEKKGKPELDIAIDWMRQLAELLEYLHGQHPAILYRDLKPSNIMITPEGIMKLIDLGGVLQYGDAGQKEQVCVGTPAYSAPEQWKGIHIEKTCDIFSFGAIFHELLTGVSPQRPPYERKPLRQYDKSIPEGLEKLIQKCTRENPKERYSSMSEVKKALDDYQSVGEKRRVVFWLKKMLVAIMAGIALLSAIVPLLRGVYQKEFPFPYLYAPLEGLGVTIVFYFFLFRFRKKSQYMIRQEKDICFTEKKGLGLLGMAVFLVGSICCFFIFSGKAGQVEAKENRNELWVDMKDAQNRNILVKRGVVFPVEDKLKLELSAEHLPDSPVSLQIVAVDRNGNTYESRVIQVRAVRE